MSYYISKVLTSVSFDEAVELVTIELKREGFGVLTQIDIQNTLKQKINADFKKYKILGACNPFFAHKALLTEDKIGLLLPCNVVVEEHDDGRIEVSAIDPVEAMSVVGRDDLLVVARDVLEKLKRVLNGLGNE